MESRFFLPLPRDVKRLLCSFLRTDDFFNLMLANPSVFLSIYSDLKNRIDFPLRKLLSHIALGEWVAAEKIWKKFPLLLTFFGTVYHPNRRYITGQEPIDISLHQNPGRYKYAKRSPWQIALMNEEYSEAHKMGQLMTEEEKQKQFQEIFPDGRLIKYNWDHRNAKRLLVNLYKCVLQDPSLNEHNMDIMNPATRFALYALYACVIPTEEHTRGLVFDVKYFIEALKLNDFSDWNHRSFWSTRVEEYLASLLGTGYLRHHLQFVGDLTGKGLNRSGCILRDDTSYFSFRRNQNILPGFNFFVTSGLCGPMFNLFRRRDFAAYFSRFVASKREEEKDLLQQYTQSRWSTLSVKLKGCFAATE